MAVGLVRRARIILLAAAGVPSDRITRELRVIDVAASGITVQGARLGEAEMDASLGRRSAWLVQHRSDPPRERTTSLGRADQASHMPHAERESNERMCHE